MGRFAELISERRITAGRCTHTATLCGHRFLQMVVDADPIACDRAEQVVGERDTIRYAISVRPAGSKEACRLDFIRNYYRAGS